MTYNDRNELTDGDRRLGTTSQDGTYMVPGDFTYAYDTISNRSSSNVDGADPDRDYTTNSVNQDRSLDRPAYAATAPESRFVYSRPYHDAVDQRRIDAVGSTNTLFTPSTRIGYGSFSEWSTPRG